MITKSVVVLGGETAVPATVRMNSRVRLLVRHQHSPINANVPAPGLVAFERIDIEMVEDVVPHVMTVRRRERTRGTRNQALIGRHVRANMSVMLVLRTDNRYCYTIVSYHAGKTLLYHS